MDFWPYLGLSSLFWRLFFPNIHAELVVLLRVVLCGLEDEIQEVQVMFRMAKHQQDTLDD